MQTLMQILLSMRPKQWTKNGLLFAGVLFSYHLDDLLLLAHAAGGFACFCVISGAIYLINDICDLEKDRLHPKKKQRPLPAGRLSPTTAATAAVLALIVGLAGAFWLNLPFGLVALTYAVLTCGYSFWFKNVAIIDVILLAMGFVLRAIGGVFVIRVPEGPEIALTPWFVVCVGFLALFIAICKRRHELLFVKDSTEHRKVLEEYTPEFLNQMISVSTSATIFAYTLYLITVFGVDSDRDGLKMLMTLPLVVFGVFRYLYLVYRRSEGGAPESTILRDKPLLLNTLVWIILVVALQNV